MYEELEGQTATGYVERITHRWEATQDVWMTTLEINTAWHDAGQ